MKQLETLAQTFQDFAARALGPLLGPSRDDLVAELDSLRAAPPPAFIDPLPPTTGLCAACADAHQVEVERRAKYMAFAGRTAALEAQLYRRSFGGGDEQDDAGRALAEVRAELSRATEEHHSRAQHWERGVEFDRRGRPKRAWSTVPGLNECGQDLAAIRRAAEALVYRSTPEVMGGIPELRRRLGEVMARPLEREIPIDDALRAGPRPPAGSEAERAGLTPGASPGVLSGTIRIGRSDST